METTYKRLIQDILELSEDKQLTWQKSSFGNQYSTSLGKGSLSITYDPVNENAIVIGKQPPVYILNFYNEKGDKFYSVACVNYIDDGFQELKELYESAHNQYMKIDDTLKSMMDAIAEKKKTF